jgi:1-acyl-sn-glycerol-3-phosphate acyltransferase
MPLPPVWVRRMVLGPAVVVLAIVLLTTLPVWLILGVAASPLVPGHLRVPRLIWLAIVYLAWDAAALVALAVLWVASGFGWRIRSAAFQRAHYVLAGRFLAVLFWVARWSLHLSIDVVGTDPDTALPGRPEIVVSRHAGPGDSFVLIDALVNWFAREPRIVLKATLQWDPAVDVLLNRLPNRFITPGRTGTETLEDEIRQLVTGLDDNDAFVIFPEGGNFTPKRRWRAILRLEQKGLAEEAARARKLEHLMAPRPNGAIAAIEACPEADVVFVAHTGLDDLVTLGDIWHRLPLSAAIKAKWWRVQAADVPRDREEQIRWLFDQWEEIDAWIAANQPAPAPAP